jgi:hypothetical protein
MNKIMRLIRTVLHDIVVAFAPKWIKKSMLTCEEISLILASDKQIPILTKVKLKSHLLICQCCTDYKKQISLINSAAQRIKSPDLTDDQLSKISSSEKKTLEKLINKNK